MTIELRDPETVARAFQEHRENAAAHPRGEEGFASFIRSTIEDVLGTEPATGPRPFSDWSSVQQAVLREIAQTPTRLVLNPDVVGELLTRVGAVRYVGDDDDRFLARYVGLCEPSVLERSVEGAPLWLSLRLHLMGSVDEATWRLRTAGLTIEERVDLVRRATDDAYHLTRRWPIPDGNDTEVEDTAALHNALRVALEPVPEEALRHVLDTELDRECPSDNVILLVASSYVEKGGAFAEAPTELVGPSLELPTSVPVGRELLKRLPPDQASALILRIELTPYNVAGWPYLDLLAQAERADVVGQAIKGFKKACNADVYEELRRVIATLDAAGRQALKPIAASDAPNAKLVAKALDSVS